MADKQECEVCKQMTREKYRKYGFWKALAIVFMCVSMVFIGLFVFSGDLFVEETVTQEIVIENGGNNNNNEDINNVVESKKTDYTPIVILLSAGVLAGGVIYGCYIVSKAKNNTKNNN